MSKDVVLIAPEHMLGIDARYVHVLKEAGFEVIYPDDPTFTRGEKTEAETIEQRGLAEDVDGRAARVVPVGVLWIDERRQADDEKDRQQEHRLMTTREL